jgi:Calx-beta domain
VANAIVLPGTSGTVSSVKMDEATVAPGEFLRSRSIQGTVWYSYSTPKPAYMRIIHDEFTNVGSWLSCEAFFKLGTTTPLYGFTDTLFVVPGDMTRRGVAIPLPYRTPRLFQFGADPFSEGTFNFDYQLITGGAFKITNLQRGNVWREGQPTMTFGVGRDGGINELATVHYAFVDESTTAGADYTGATALNGVLTFEPGVSLQTLTLNILDDATPEGSESLRLVLNNPSLNSTFVERSPGASFVIEDNDSVAANDDFGARALLTGSSGTITLPNQQATREPGEPPELSRSLWYTWTAPATGLLQLASRNALGPAMELSVYTGSSLADLVGVANVDKEIPPGFPGSSRTLLVTAGTTYQIAVANFSTANAPSTLVYDLQTNAISAFRFAAMRTVVLEKTRSVTVQVQRLGSSTGAVSVSYRTPIGTPDSDFPVYPWDTTRQATSGIPGIPGSDYGIITSGQLDFADGETTKEITISIIPDSIKEGAEHFRILLYSPSVGSVLAYPYTTAIDIQEGTAPVLPPFPIGAWRAVLQQPVGTTGQGFISLSLTSTGAFTGALTIDGVKRTFSSRFPRLTEFSPGQATEVTLKLGPTSAPNIMKLRFALDARLSTPMITGTVSDGTYTSRFYARSILDKLMTLERMIVAGAYTVALQPDPGVPAAFQAPGFLTLKVSDTGIVTTGGRLPDGSAVTATGILTQSPETYGLEAFFITPLYTSRGQLSGGLRLGYPGDLSGVPKGGEGDGRLLWVHPNRTTGPVLTAFVGALEASISRFLPLNKMILPITPPKSFQVSLKGGGFADTSFNFNLLAGNVVSIVPGSSIAPKLTLTASNGRFSGQFKPVGSAVAIPFQGVLLPNFIGGRGYFRNGALPGTVTISAP